MMKTFLSMWVIAVPILADSIPAGWTVVKDRKGACQVGVPADFKVDAMMSDLAKGGTIEVEIFSSPGPVKPINETVGKMMKIDKFFENTPNRVFYAEEAVKVRDGRTLVSWKYKVPAPGGNCWANIVFQPGASEDLMKKIAGTVGPAK